MSQFTTGMYCEIKWGLEARIKEVDDLLKEYEGCEDEDSKKVYKGCLNAKKDCLQALEWIDCQWNGTK